MFTCTMYINQTQAVDQLKTQLDMGTTMMLLEVEMLKMEIILVIICDDWDDDEVEMVKMEIILVIICGQR